MLLVNSRPANTMELRLFAGLQCLFFGALWLTTSQGTVIGNVLQLLFCVAVIIGILGLLKPALVSPIHRIWMMLVTPIGWGISRLLLAIVFFGVVTPIGVWRRIWYGDPLQRKFSPTAITYWEEHHQKRKHESYFRQF